ncbi:MAG TPA: hypothetical protein VIG64_01130, partial [Actinomycetota bacterium]
MGQGPDERDLERILSGVAPSGDGEPLEAFVGQVREMYSVSPDTAIRERHLARIHQVAGSSAPAPFVPSRTRTPAWLPLRSLAARAGTVAVAAVVTTGGLAAAGALPGPMQDAVSTVASKIGLDLPRADERDKDQDERRRGNAPDPSAEASPSPTVEVEGDNSGPGSTSSGPGGPRDHGRPADDNSGPGNRDGRGDRSDNSGPGTRGKGRARGHDNSGPG